MSNLHNNPHLELPPAQSSQQQHIASVYPKLPSQDELPSYTPYPTQQPQKCDQQPQYNQQPPYIQQPQYNQQPQYIQQPQYNQQQPQYCNHPPTQQQPMFYGSVAAPNVSMPTPIQPQNSQQPLNVEPINGLRTKSELVECPHCRQLVYTVLDYDAGVCTGLSIAGLFLAGCSNGLCLLPWLFPWTKDVTHQCPSCKEKIATFTRLERDTRVHSRPEL